MRDGLRYRASQSAEPGDKVREAKAFLQMLAESPQFQLSPLGTMLKKELEYIKSRADAYVLHEYLEDINEPLYFEQFAQRIAAASLQYLGDARFNGTPGEDAWPRRAKFWPACRAT